MIATAPILANEDAGLATQLTAHLAETRRAGLRQLAVAVSGNKVTLHGHVSSYYEKQIAIETCRTRAGAGWLIDAADVNV